VIRREFSDPVANLWAFYEATRDENYLIVLRETLDQFPEQARQYAEMRAEVVFRVPMTAQQFVAAVLTAVRGPKMPR